MKNKRALHAFILFILLKSLPASSQESDKPKLQITPIARFYLDGAVYLKDQTNLSNGTTIPDVRLGLKANYGNFDIKVDIGFSEKKVKPKDIFVDYHLNKNSYLRAGHVAIPFGIECWETTSSMKFLSENPNSLLFGTDRILNIMYSHYGKKYVVNASIMGDSNAFTNDVEGNDGYGFAVDGKYVAHQKETSLFILGVSNYIRTGNANGYNDEGKENPRLLTFSSVMNTKVEKRPPIAFGIEDVKYQNNTVLYMEGRYNKLFLHTEGFMMNVKREKGLPNYKAGGFYAQGGILLFGDKTYNYDCVEKKTTRPNKGLELVVRYSYTNMDDNSSGIKPGKMTDISFASNYYVNNHVCVRLNYIIQKMGNNCAFLAGERVNIIQARLQVLF